jgi:serine/threonine protein kinase
MTIFWSESAKETKEKIHPFWTEMLPLSAYSELRRTLPWHARFQLAADVATALLFLHSAQDAVIHRDLEPANILLDEHMRAKLTDVGLAALLPAVAPDTSAIALTHATTRIMGSPQVESQPFLAATNMVFLVETFW